MASFFARPKSDQNLWEILTKSVYAGMKQYKILDALKKSIKKESPDLDMKELRNVGGGGKWFMLNRIINLNNLYNFASFILSSLHF